MSSSPQTPKQNMKRRQFLKAVAGTGALATVGGASMHSDRLQPVGQSEAACLPCVAVVAGSTVVAAHAGMVAGNKIMDILNGNEDAEEVSQDAVRDVVYNRASGIGSQRSEFRSEIQQRWLNRPVDNNPTADAIFAEAEARAAEQVAKGNAIDAEQVALGAVDKHITIAMYNLIQDWNLGLTGSEDTDGLLGAMVAAYNNGTKQFGCPGSWDGQSAPINLGSVTKSQIQSSDTQSISSTNTSGDEHIVWKHPVHTSFPTALSQIDEVDADECYMYAPVFSDSTSAFVCPKSGIGVPQIDYSPRIQEINVYHPDYNTTLVLDTNIYDNQLQNLWNIRDQLITQVQNYITTLKDQLAEGVIDPADIVSPYTAVKKFADSDQKTRAAAHLAFTGAHVPKGSLGFQAEVSHPDIQSESLWGQLSIAYADGVSPASLKPGMTISASKYDMAYLQFTHRKTGDPVMRQLGGGSDLQILDVTDLEGDSEQDTTNGARQEAGANGRVYVWDESVTDKEVPAPYQYPADHSNWTVAIDGDVNNDQLQVSDVQEDSEGYYVEPTNLAEGETVHTVRLIEPIGMEKTTSYIANPGSVNEEQIKERLRGLRELQEEIENLEDSTVAGGGLFGGGLPSLPGLTFVQSALVTGGGLVGLSFLKR